MEETRLRYTWIQVGFPFSLALLASPVSLAEVADGPSDKPLQANCSREQEISLENHLSRKIRGSCGALPLVYKAGKNDSVTMANKSYAAYQKLPQTDGCPSQDQIENRRSTLAALDSIENVMIKEAQRIRNLCFSDEESAKASLNAQANACAARLSSASSVQEIKLRMENLSDGFREEADAELRNHVAEKLKLANSINSQLRVLLKCRAEKMKEFYRKRDPY